jgi:GT2 family glycosyltransferase
LTFWRELGAALRVTNSVARRLAANPRRLGEAARTGFLLLRHDGLSGVRRELARRAGRRPDLSYQEWVARYDLLTAEGRQELLARLPSLRKKPLFSVLMPVYDTQEVWLRRAVQSVVEQVYPHWELCIADDASRAPHVKRVLDELAASDPRIRVVHRQANGHISAASNSALGLARGEYIALLDHDDELPPHALFRVAEELDAWPDAAIVYSDEDKIDERGVRLDPYFKPDWNPDLFCSHNLVSHLGAYRTGLVRELGGFREGLEGSQDWDLALRVSEKVRPEQIRHIPAVLYHWRILRGSTALAPGEKSYAEVAARKAIQDHFGRGQIDAEALPGATAGLQRARYRLLEPPLVSLIIPTRDSLPLLKACVESLLSRTDYPRYELIVVDNQSSDAAALSYLQQLEQRGAARVIRYPKPFNYSDINNLAAREARGALLGFLNNDLEVIERGWLLEMASHAVRKEIGAVGARLLFPNGTVQHAGIFLGLGRDRVAGTPHRGFPRSSFGHFGRAAVIQDFSAVSAACLLMRKEVFEEAAGFDAANLPVSYNDIDLCLRLREKGYRILWTPYAELYHKESATRGSDEAPEKRERFLTEVEYMRRRWGHLLESDPFFNPNLSLDSDAFFLAAPPRTPRPSQPLHPAR